MSESQYTSQSLREQWAAADQSGWEQDAQRLAERAKQRDRIAQVEQRMQAQIDSLARQLDQAQTRVTTLEERIAWYERDVATVAAS